MKKVIFFLKSFVGLRKSRTFASAKRGKSLVRRLRIEFFDRFFINRQLVQEASSACLVGHILGKCSEPSIFN